MQGRRMGVLSCLCLSIIIIIIFTLWRRIQLLPRQLEPDPVLGSPRGSWPAAAAGWLRGAEGGQRRHRARRLQVPLQSRLPLGRVEEEVSEEKLTPDLVPALSLSWGLGASKPRGFGLGFGRHFIPCEDPNLPFNLGSSSKGGLRWI